VWDIQTQDLLAAVWGAQLATWSPSPPTHARCRACGCTGDQHAWRAIASSKQQRRPLQREQWELCGAATLQQRTVALHTHVPSAHHAHATHIRKAARGGLVEATGDNVLAEPLPDVRGLAAGVIQNAGEHTATALL
jgi:hypothetical protein